VNLLQSLVPEDFRRAIDATLRRFYTCTFLMCIGNGLTLSLYVVYLHNVRGFSTSFATLLLGGSAVAGLVTGPLWGTLTDRIGPIWVAMSAYVFEAAALVVWAYAHTKLQAIIAAMALAIFGGAGWGPAGTMLSRLVSEEHRQRAFGFNFMLVNLGIGFGGLVSASIVDLHHPQSFTVLYLIDAVVTLLVSALFFTLRKSGGPVTEHHDDPVKSAEGWREVLRDRRLVQFVLAALVLMIGGYGSQEAGFSLFVVNNLKLPVHVIGIIFFFNTTTIVVAQLWVLNRIEGRSRTRVMAIAAALWFVFWMILDIALTLPAFFAVASLCIAMVVFAIGETMLSPVGPALVNEIAPEHLRGRYNAAQGLTWGLAGSLAPAITAIYFDNHLGNWWPASTGATALLGGLLMLNLRRKLSVEEDGRVASPA
jgi:MFS family permease